VQADDWESHRKDPFQLFDNVHYVGTQRVSAYLIETPGGLILIDATYPETADFVLDNIRTLGFDPVDVEYVFITHGHGDHYGGAVRIQEATGARVGMSAADWELVEERARTGGPALERDLVIEDNDVITLGRHAVRFLVTPGHTPGSLSMEYVAHSPGAAFRVLTPGGLGFNFGPDGAPLYLESLERMRRVQPDVILANHPFMGPVDLFDAEAAMRDLESAQQHPLAGRRMVEEWFDALEAVTREKLEVERAGR
jgi:metallo-beta-lactamase class B